MRERERDRENEREYVRVRERGGEDREKEEGGRRGERLPASYQLSDDAAGSSLIVHIMP